MNSLGHTWWNQIYSPRKFLNSIIQILTDKKSVVLNLNDGIPWKQDLKQILQTELAQSSASSVICFENTYGEERFSSLDQVYKYLMDLLLEPAMLRKYRPAMDGAVFLAEQLKQVNKETYLWLQNLGHHSRELLVQAVYNIQKADPKCSNFSAILDPIQKECPIRQEDAAKYLHDYDKQTFISLLLVESDLPSIFKGYMAKLLFELTCHNLEILDELMSYQQELLYDPKPFYERAGLSAGEGNTALWNTQIAILFPIMEEYRQYIIGRYRHKIEENLPDFRDSVDDVEIADLAWMIRNQILWVEKSILETYDYFYDVRNALAHLESVDFDHVQIVLDWKYNKSHPGNS